MTAQKHFAALDGIRGLAAIAIMFRHMAVLGVTSPSQSYLAVDLFFLLSGAVIAHANDRRLLAGASLGEFCVRRLIRLYPMVALGVGLGVLNVLFGQTDADTHGHLWLATLSCLILLPNNPIVARWDLDGPGWSLSYELVANIAYAALIRHLTLKRLAMICGGSALLLIAAAIYKGNLDTGNSQKSIPFGLARVGFSFFGGVILYRLHCAGSLRIPDAWRGYRGLAAALVLLAAALLTTPPHWAQGICSLVSVCVLMPAIVVLGLENTRPPQRLCKVLGESSYPLYLIHAPLAFLTAGMLRRHGIDHLGVAATAFVPAVVALSLVAGRYYDAPVRAALTAAWRARRSGLAFAERPS